ncbi:hypothetical protein MMC25_004688 [Agyrium rufum]|nr:hypothetical protein [Agyrium rufum]
MSCGSYEFYQRKRQLEIGGMKRATEIMEKKKAERERQMDETRRLRRVRREDEERRKEAESRAKSGDMAGVDAREDITCRPTETKPGT